MNPIINEREILKSNGITDEQISEIMAIHDRMASQPGAAELIAERMARIMARPPISDEEYVKISAELDESLSKWDI